MVLAGDEAELAFEKGEVDEFWSGFPSKNEFEPKRVQKVEFAFYGTYQFVLNVHNGIFANPKVRAAFAKGVDRLRIFDSLKRPGRVATSYIPPGLPGYVGRSPEFNPKAAKSELARLLKDNERTVTLILHESYESKKVFIETLASVFDDIGLDLKIDYMAFKPALKAMKNHSRDMIFKADSIQYYETSTIFVTLQKGNFSNISHYENTELESIIKRAQATIDLKDKSMILAKAEEVLRKDWPIVPLFYPSRTSYYDGELNIPLRGVNELRYWEFPYRYFSWRN